MRPAAAVLEPYDAAFSQAHINLSANENDYPMPAAAREAIDAAIARTPTNRYPIAMADELREAIAAWHGIGKDQVIVGNGGDELLFNLILAFGGTDRPLLVLAPTFSVYELYAKLLETPVIRLWRDPDTFGVDEDRAVEAAGRANLIIVTTPNNPTGNLSSPEFVARLCDACPGIVLADEAYIEFAEKGSSSEGLLVAHDNLSVLRTLSKAYQFAGGRLGYALASADVIAALAAVRQPYSVSVLAQAAALAVIEHRFEFQHSIDRIRQERQRTLLALASLSDMGLRVWPSSANFLLVRLPHAAEARARLRDEFSILVRDLSDTPGLTGCLRITVGRPDENDAVIGAITTILRGESQ